MNFIQKMVSAYKGAKFDANLSLKQDEVAGKLIAPVFQEVPPNSKAGKFISEGLRSWSFIAISSIADEISTTPLNILKKDKEGTWVVVDSHQALQLIEKPNSFQTKEEFFWLASVYWLSEGEAPIYLNSPKNPTEMVLLNPERITVMFDNKNIVGGYKYRQSNGTLTDIPAENMIMLKMPSVSSPFRGAGVMKYIAQTLDIDNYIEEYLKLFFFNDTTPGAVLETSEELTQTIIDRLKNQFKNRHQGVKNSHKLSILEKGLTYKKISSNISELQLKELNDMIRDKVLAAFKVPKSVLGITEDVNRANAEASSYTFSKRSVYPKLKMIEGQLNQFLLPKFSDGVNLWFEFENPVFEDKLLTAQVDALGIQNGWLLPNEVRERMGLDPIEEEEVEPMEMPDEDIDEEPKKGKYAKSKKIKKVRETKRPSGLVDIMKDILESEKPAPKAFYDEQELTEFNTKKLTFLNPLEKGYKKELEENFTRQKNVLLKQISGKSVKSNSLNLQLDAEEELAQMIKISNPYLYDAVIKQGKLTFELLGVTGTLLNENQAVKKFIKDRTLKLGKETTATTQAKVDLIVKEWSEKGGSWTDLRSDLTDYFESTGANGAGYRADMISRTELANATGFAQEEVYKQTGAVGKKWLTSANSCEWCVEMSGEVADITDNFFNKGDTLPSGQENDWDAISTPPLHPNCTCDIIPIYGESKSSKGQYLAKFDQLKEKTIKEHDHAECVAKKEAEILAKEMALIEKEQKIAENEIATEQTLAEAKKAKELAKKELKEVEEYNKKLNGKIKKA